MEMYEIIRYLRMDLLLMSQEDFGRVLGVSRSVIRNIELNLLARPEQKEPLIKLICKEFEINEDWLRNGTGDLFESVSIYDEFTKNVARLIKGEDERAIQFINNYCSLSPETKSELWSIIDELAKKKEETDQFNE